MAERISNWNERLFQPTANAPNPDTLIATPAIWTPGMDESEWGDEVTRMCVRAMAARDFLNGDLHPSDFAEVLYETGYDPNQCADNWEEGRSLLLP